MKVRMWAAAALLVVAAGTPLVGAAYADGGTDSGSGTGSGSGDAIGGYTASISATPVSVQVYEPVIPLPVQPGKPQGELDLSFTNVSSSTGPSNFATASSLWPGSGLGDGFTTITQTFGLGAADYPIKAQASYPGGPPTSTQGAPPVATMASSADDKSAAAAATVADLLPAGNALVDAGQISSRSATAVADDKVSATTTSLAQDLSLAGGLIDVATVRTDAALTSTAADSASTGALAVTGLSIAGFQFVVDQDGVHASGQGQTLPKLPIPGLPTQPVDALKAMGITFSGPKVEKHVAGTTATYQARALEISIDTVPLKNALQNLTHYQDTYQQLIGSLPGQLQQVVDNPQIPSLVELGPRIVYDLGLVTAKTTASAQYTYNFPTLPVPGPPVSAPLGGGGLPPLPGSSMGDLGSTGSLPSVAPSDQGPVVAGGAQKASALASPFGGLPAWTILVALAAAAAVGLGLRQVAMLAGMLPAGGGSCRLGAGSGVPNLREG